MRTMPEVLVAEPYEETAMKSTSIGRSMARERSLMKCMAPLSTQTISGGVSA